MHFVALGLSLFSELSYLSLVSQDNNLAIKSENLKAGGSQMEFIIRHCEIKSLEIIKKFLSIVVSGCTKWLHKWKKKIEKSYFAASSIPKMCS